jgi:hypothetical protein
LPTNWGKTTFTLGWGDKPLSDIGRAPEQLLSQIERAKAEQLDLARSWILLLTLAATVGLWWVFYSQLNLDFIFSGLLGFGVAYVLGRILAFCVGMKLGGRHARKLNNQLLGQSTIHPDQVSSSGGVGTGISTANL